MKKLLMSLFSIGIIANTASTTLSVMSNSVITNENNIQKNSTFTINDLMNLEQNENTQNTKITSNFIASDNLNNLVSTFSTNKILSLNKLLKTLGNTESSQMKLNGLISLVNISQLFSSVLGKLLTEVSAGIDTKSSSIVIENIFKNLSVDQILTEMNKFGTYDDNGNCDISKSPFIGKTYSSLLATVSVPFTTSILKTITSPTSITDTDGSNIIDGMLLMMNYLSQYNYTIGSNLLDPNGLTDIFKSSNGKGDPLYKQSIYNQTFNATSYTNLQQLLNNINDYHNDYGIGFRQLLFILFGFSQNFSSQLTNGVLSHGKGYDWRINIQNTVTGEVWTGSDHFQSNPGTIFAEKIHLFNLLMVCLKLFSQA